MKLIDYIKQNRLTQNKFAIKSGLTRSAICRILKSERFPTPDTMNKIELATLGQVKANDFLKQMQEKMSSYTSKEWNLMSAKTSNEWKKTYNGR